MALSLLLAEARACRWQVGLKKEINSIDDLQGLKNTHAWFGRGSVKAGGCIACDAKQVARYSVSLQSGAIDATEWVGPYNDKGHLDCTRQQISITPVDGMSQERR